jgi:hydroxyacylglutathione hydrolase
MLRVETIPVTLFSQNARIIWDTESKLALAIDPGGESHLLRKFVDRNGLKLSEIWLTHSHLDHVGGVKVLQEATGASLVGHQAEAPMRAAVPQICMMFGVPRDGFEICPEPDLYLWGGEKLTFAGREFQVIFTPGHSPGHLAFYCPTERFVLSGDALFQGSVGRTDLPGGSHPVLLESIQKLITTLPPETAVLSGHGPDTTLAIEKEQNPFLKGLFPEG